MDMLHGVGTAVLFGLGWLIGISIGANFLQRILQPLEPPLSPTKKLRGEWILGGFFLIVHLHWAGVLILALAYIYSSQRREMPAPEPRKPFIPKFALSDLLAMVFSIGFAPVVFAMLYFVNLRNSSYQVVVVAAILFPIAFLYVAQCLNAHNVPAGAVRAAFVFIFPYLVYSCLFFFARGTILLVFVALGAKSDLDNIGPNYAAELMIRMAIAAAFTLLGFVITRAAAAQSLGPSAQPPVESVQNPL